MTSKVQAEPRRTSPDRLPAAAIAAFGLLIASTVGVSAFWLSHMRFSIPAGSMQPTLLIGDFVLVSRTSYGFNFDTLMGRSSPMSARYFEALPERGDIAVFRLPRDPDISYIKRVIGLPGDEILLRKGVLSINGKQIPKVRRGEYLMQEGYESARRVPVFEETLPNGRVIEVLESESDGQFDSVGPYRVPDGHYFVMGDNRDNSNDSRAAWGVGFVPLDNFVGRVSTIYFSMDGWRVRWDRIGRVPK